MLRLTLFVLVLCGVPVAAQETAAIEATRLCGNPPLSRMQVDLIERRADFPALLDGMALHCPEVAMLFARWMVGEVDGAPLQSVPRRPQDFLHLIAPHCPVKDVASIPSF